MTPALRPRVNVQAIFGRRLHFQSMLGHMSINVPAGLRSNLANALKLEYGKGLVARHDRIAGESWGARPAGQRRMMRFVGGRSPEGPYTRVFNTWFWCRLEIADFCDLGSPAAGKPFQKVGCFARRGASRPTNRKGFPGRRARPDPRIDGSRSAQKPCIKNPSAGPSNGAPGRRHPL